MAFVMTSGPSGTFLDQTGFRLQPTVRRPWEPQGQTPIHYRWDRHDRLSVTGTITVSPARQRVGLYFSIASFTITGGDVLAFVQHRRGHLQRPLRLIWDRFSGHKKAVRLLRDL